MWLTSPCPDAPSGGQGADRTEYLNETVIPAVVAARADIAVFDLEAKLCADGRALTETTDGDALRYDEVHFSPAGSRWIADRWADEILALGT